MKFRCQSCYQMFEPEPDEDTNPRPKLCGWCFEASLEEYEEKKRERIARENEY